MGRRRRRPEGGAVRLLRGRGGRLLVVALGVVIVAGGWLTGASHDTATPPTVSRLLPGAGPPRGGRLIVALDADPGSLNPAVTSNPGVHTASELMFNGLVGWGPDNQPVPELAERWTVDEGGAAYTFTLRDGVRWHDGRALSSDDVRFSFERALLPLHSRTKASMGSAGLRLDTPDPRTVVFRFDAPYAPLLRQLNVTEAPIIPKHVFEGCADLSTTAGCPPNKAPVGSGPFRFVSFSPTEIRLARNSDYFRPDLPRLDEVVQRVIPDADRRVRALESGEVDWLWTVPGPEVARLRAGPAVTVVPTTRSPGGGNCMLQVAFNLRPPTGRLPLLVDQRVRQAFAHATDRRQAVDGVLFGQGRVAEAPISSGIPFAHAPGLGLPAYDPVQARSLLDAAGWKDEGGAARVSRGVAGVPDGTALVIELVHLAGQGDLGVGLRTQLEAVGVSLVAKPSDSAALNDNVFTRRTFDTALVSYCNGDDPEVGVRRQYATDQIGPAAMSNAAGNANPEVDALFDQAVRQTGTEERGLLYRRIQEAAVRDLPYWWLAELDLTRAHDTACTGFDHANTGLFAETATCPR